MGWGLGHGGPGWPISSSHSSTAAGMCGLGTHGDAGFDGKGRRRHGPPCSGGGATEFFDGFDGKWRGFVG